MSDQLLIRRATEQQQSEWRPVDEGLWRWVIGKPVIRSYMREGAQQHSASFPLNLTAKEVERLKEAVGDLPDGVQQSYRSSYMTGLSLGFFKAGAYQSTKLVDFLAAALGVENGKKFRQWVEKGGGPPIHKDMSQQEQISTIEEWLGWWEDLEVYGSVRHEADKKDQNQVWARFAGPLPVGFLPGQKEDEYQAIARGKLRAMATEAGKPPERKEPAEVAREAAAAIQTRSQSRSYGEVFDDDDEPGSMPRNAQQKANRDRMKTDGKAPFDPGEDLPF